jgi:enoyl-CoA hydratase/carnithine racemase
MIEQPRLLTRQVGRVLTVSFNNHPRHFFDRRMAAELDNLTRKLKRDKTVGSVVFTGTDRTYITHLDLPVLESAARALPFHVPYPAARVITGLADLAGGRGGAMRLMRETPLAGLEFMNRTYAALRRMNTIDKVFIASINGLALGMGCVFALACDIRVIADDALIGLPESSIGMLAAAGGTQRLTRILGSARSLELLLDGQPLDAATAARYGLVNRVVPRSDLRSETDLLAQRLGNRSPQINREIKRMVYDAGGHRLSRAMRMEAASLVATVTSHQARSRISAYREWLTEHPDLSDDAITSGFKAAGSMRIS